MVAAWRSVLAVVVLGLVAVAVGLAPPEKGKEDKPKPTPIVTVTKTDGTLVKGKLILAEWDHIVVLAKDEAGAEKETSLAWKEIGKVSTGLTKAKVVEEFRKEHAGRLCETCLGAHEVRCDTCKGTGHAAEAGKDCPRCKGELLVNCTTPKCKEGKVPCPRPCLKLSEGVWVLKDDGKKWREFPLAGGQGFRISDSHLGEIWVKTKDGKSMESQGRCDTCQGKTTVTDAICWGTGKVSCPECKKRDGAACVTCEGGGTVKCATCDGSGLKK